MSFDFGKLDIRDIDIGPISASVIPKISFSHGTNCTIQKVMANKKLDVTLQKNLTKIDNLRSRLTSCCPPKIIILTLLITFLAVVLFAASIISGPVALGIVLGALIGCKGLGWFWKRESYIKADMRAAVSFYTENYKSVCEAINEALKDDSYPIKKKKLELALAELQTGYNYYEKETGLCGLVL